MGFSNPIVSDGTSLTGSDLIKETEDWSKRYVWDAGCKLELIDPFTGKLVPKASLHKFVFKPEIKTIFKIKDKKKVPSKTIGLNASMGDSGIGCRAERGEL
jgi:hypothetical protein